MRTIKIGDKITYRTWLNEEVTASVTAIEICKRGEKDGRSVRHCNLDLHNNVVLTLNDRHWCSKHQVKQIIPNRYAS